MMDRAEEMSKLSGEELAAAEREQTAIDIGEGRDLSRETSGNTRPPEYGCRLNIGEKPETDDHPEMPEICATALREGVKYVDATKLIEATLNHVKVLDNLVAIIGRALVKSNESLIRAHRKLIELEADMGAAKIGAANDTRSALIMPDHIRRN